MFRNLFDRRSKKNRSKNHKSQRRLAFQRDMQRSLNMEPLEDRRLLASVPIDNPSFETPVLTDGGFTPLGTIPSWTVGAAMADILDPVSGEFTVANAGTDNVPDGENIAVANQDTISQSLTTLVAVDTVYQLQVDVGDRTSQPFPGYTIELKGGTTVLGSTTQTTFMPPNGGFVTASVYTTIEPGNLNIGSALGVNLSSSGTQTSFDNVRLDSTSLVIDADDVGIGVNNNINISLDGGGTNVVVTVDGTKVLDLPTTEVPNITVNGQTGDDTLTVDHANGNPIPAGGISFVGGETDETSGDDLIITGYNLPTANGTADVTVNHTGVEAGNLVLAGLGTISFSQIEPLTLAGTAADLVINLPAGPNTDVVIGDDTPANFPGNGTSAANTSAIDASTFEYTAFTSPTNSLTVNLGNGGDTISMRAMDTAFAPAGAAVAAEFMVNGGNGGNTFNVQATTTGITTLVTGGNNADDVYNVSSDAPTNAGNLNSIDGSLLLHADGGGVTGDILNISESGSAAADAVTVDLIPPTRTILGTAGGGWNISRTGSIFRGGINISLGSTADVVHVLSTGSVTSEPITIDGNGGDDIFNLGTAANSLDGIIAPVTFNGNGNAAGDTLNVSDQGDASVNSYVVTSDTIVRNGSPTVTYGTLESVILNSGSGGNTVNVQSTAATTPVTINSGSGVDAINIGSAANSLGTILGNVIVSGDANDPTPTSDLTIKGDTNMLATGDILNLNDQGDAGGFTYTVDATTVTRTGGTGTITYGTIETLNLKTSMGVADVDVTSTADGANTNITTQDMADDIDVTTTGTDSNVVINTAGGADDINIATTGGDGGDAETLLGSFTQVNAGADGDTITLQSSGIASRVQLNGQAGADKIDIQGTGGATSAVDIDGGADTDTSLIPAATLGDLCVANVEILLGSIHGYKFNDMNGNGQDDGDPRLGGVTITLEGDVDGDGDIDQLVTQTDASDPMKGEYWFENLFPGTYTVTETPPQGSVATSPPATVTIISGEEAVAVAGQSTMIGQQLPDWKFESAPNPDLAFGNIVAASIHGFKFEDWKHIGEFEPAFDQPMPGVQFTLTGTNSVGAAVNMVATTDVNGQFEFTGLLPSMTGYTVTEIVPPGQSPTTPTSFTTNLMSGQELVAMTGQAGLPEFPGDTRMEVLIGTPLIFGSAAAGNVVFVLQQGNDLMLLGNASNNHIEVSQTKDSGEFTITGKSGTQIKRDDAIVPFTTVNFINGDIGVMLAHGDDTFELTGAADGSLSKVMHDLTIENDSGSNLNVIEDVSVMRDLTVEKVPGVWGYSQLKIIDSIVEGNTIIHNGTPIPDPPAVIALAVNGAEPSEPSGGDSKTLIENSQLRGRQVTMEQVDDDDLVLTPPALEVLNGEGFDIVDIRDTKVGVNRMGDAEITNGDGGSRTTFASENALGNVFYGNLHVINGTNLVGVQVYDTVIFNQTEVLKSTKIDNMDGDSMVVVMDNSVLGSSATLATVDMTTGKFTDAGKLVVHNSAGIDEFMMKDSKAPFGVVIENGGQGYAENDPDDEPIAVAPMQLYGSRTDIISSQIGTNLKSDGGLIVRGDDKDDVVNVIDSWIGGLRGIDIETYHGNDEVWLFLKDHAVAMVLINTGNGMDQVRLEEVFVTNGTMIDLGAAGLDRLELVKATQLHGGAELRGGTGEMDQYIQDIDAVIKDLWFDGFEIFDLDGLP